MTRFRIIVAFAFGSQLLGCEKAHEPHNGQRESTPVLVSVATADRRPGTDVYVATASVRGRTTATLTSKAMGHVKKLDVSAGDDVKRGQLLIELDARDARASIAQARAAVAQAEAAIARAESDLQAARVDRELAELTWKRVKRLAEQSAVTDQQRDQADKALAAARAREQIANSAILGARSQLQQAHAGRELAAAQLDYREVRAPFDGRVVQRTVDLGDLASPGTPLLTLQDMSRLQAEAVVDESQAGHIQLGQSTSVEVEAAGVQVTGVVAEIVPAVDMASRAFVVKVDLGAGEELAQVRPGMFARVRFPVGERERLVVPEAALSRRGSLERLFVVEEGLARLRLVTSGLARDGEVEILSGLTAGELVVTDNALQLADATRVEVKR